MSAQVSSQETWQVVTDLKLYAEAEDNRFDYGLWTESFEYLNPRTFRQETVYAVRKDELTDALQWWLHETAEALLAGLRQADINEHGDPAGNGEEES
jgi:hypothetical protein